MARGFEVGGMIVLEEERWRVNCKCCDFATGWSLYTAHRVRSSFSYDSRNMLVGDLYAVFSSSLTRMRELCRALGAMFTP